MVLPQERGCSRLDVYLGVRDGLLFPVLQPLELLAHLSALGTAVSPPCCSPPNDPHWNKVKFVVEKKNTPHHTTCPQLHISVCSSVGFSRG